ncbi:glycosyltransferase family 2 protein [Hydrotalea sandarakina]|jgi:GT2 family glycosyltransferase|uniref:GT2 family glycosyltransferase n=1 Tax=Hydrotalea sandarakina TaxID=1004304 RepID=A0A2W7S6S0_9BACT|nr:glycosyltransferase [Hydrotalea sandarakina]PZX62937.1 GT2 family glycosyltransferase [Hydrotalea sandarakina]
MQLSVIIVSYNVQHFLAQCLLSVQNALKTIPSEIIVVDNASTDETVSALQPLFPNVQWMCNTTNEGFSKACNRAAALAKGEYFIFLNPDTLVPPSFFISLLNFANKCANCGAIGVKMIDGAGNFLPESKRSFPTPLAAFFKLCGLAALFPRSAYFNQYALGQLHENDIHTVSVLSGACMLVPQKVFKSIQGFDEAFFMYGEDIDLSYRIEQAGYNNYYLGTCCLIHFKGESKPTAHLQHVQQFYGAMRIFVQKHYKGTKAFLMRVILQFAIFFAAVTSSLLKPVQKHYLMLIDAVVVIAANVFAILGWKYMAHNGLPFNTYFVTPAPMVYAGIFIFVLWMGGLYDGKYKLSQTIISGLLALIILLAFYALLAESIRFSRGVVILSGVLALFGIVLLRTIFKPYQNNMSLIDSSSIVIGNQEAQIALKNLLPQANDVIDAFQEMNAEDFLKNSKTIASLRLRLPLIFCWDEEISLEWIIEQMQLNKNKYVYRFFNSTTQSIISSSNKWQKGNVVSALPIYAICRAEQKRMKRLLDVIFALFWLAMFEIIIWRKQGQKLLTNAFLVLQGKKTWIGYAGNNPNLPNLLPGILNTIGNNSSQPLTLPPTLIQKQDEWYALHYEWPNDIIFMYQHLNALFKNA